MATERTIPPDELLWDIDTVPDKPPRFPRLRKFLLLAMGIFVIILLLSYIFVTFPVADILQGKWQSSRLEGNTLNVDNLLIQFQNRTEETLQSLYFQQQKNELSLCLQGHKEGNTYQITSLYQPTMYQQSFNHVTFESCSAETIIILHTHPYLRCAASSLDLATLRKTQQQNPETLMVVMCSPKRFAVYK